MTSPHLRVASNEESKEREKIIRCQVFRTYSESSCHPPILPFTQGIGCGGSACFAFISMVGHLIMEEKRPGISNTTYRRLCALAQWNSNIHM